MYQFVFASVVLFSGAVLADSNDQDVPEYNISYRCCEPFPIVPNKHCKQTFTTSEKQTFAIITDSQQSCVDPCQKDSDNLKIRGCVDFTQNIVCKNGTFTFEEIFHCNGQPCQQSRSSQTRLQPQGPVGLLLVALFIIGFFSYY